MRLPFFGWVIHIIICISHYFNVYCSITVICNQLDILLCQTAVVMITLGSLFYFMFLKPQGLIFKQADR